MNGHHDTVFERVPSGIPGLDTILHGGFLKGGLYILQGAPGTGKTTMGNQICFHHIALGGQALYVTLLAEYHARMLQHLGGMAFFDVSKIPDQLAYQNGLQILHESGLKGLLGQLRREIVAHRATILILDGIVSARAGGAGRPGVQRVHPRVAGHRHRDRLHDVPADQHAGHPDHARAHYGGRHRRADR